MLSTGKILLYIRKESNSLIYYYYIRKKSYVEKKIFKNFFFITEVPPFVPSLTSLADVPNFTKIQLRRQKSRAELNENKKHSSGKNLRFI